MDANCFYRAMSKAGRSEMRLVASEMVADLAGQMRNGFDTCDAREGAWHAGELAKVAAFLRRAYTEEARASRLAGELEAPPSVIKVR